MFTVDYWHVLRSVQKSRSWAVSELSSLVCMHQRFYKYLMYERNIWPILTVYCRWVALCLLSWNLFHYAGYTTVTLPCHSLIYTLIYTNGPNITVTLLTQFTTLPCISNYNLILKQPHTSSGDLSRAGVRCGWQLHFQEKLSCAQWRDHVKASEGRFKPSVNRPTKHSFVNIFMHPIPCSTHTGIYL